MHTRWTPLGDAKRPCGGPAACRFLEGVGRDGRGLDRRAAGVSEEGELGVIEEGGKRGKKNWVSDWRCDRRRGDS